MGDPWSDSDQPDDGRWSGPIAVVLFVLVVALVIAACVLLVLGVSSRGTP